MDVPGAHRVSDLEARGAGRRPVEMRVNRCFRIVERQLAVQPDARAQRMAGGNLVLADEAVRDDAALEPQKPALVIGGGKISERWQVFERGAPAIDRPPGICVIRAGYLLLCISSGPSARRGTRAVT